MISLVHRTIFVHIPKCAGQSVEAAFCADLGLTWQKHRFLLGCFQRPAGWAKALPDRLAHLSAHEYVDRNFLPATLFESFYSFAIIRDPVERAISMWRFLPYEGAFDTFVQEELPIQISAGHFFYRSQCAYLHHPKTGKLLVDHVVPFSRLSEHWPDIMRRSGLSAPIGHRNTAPSQKQRPEVGSELAKTLSRLYSEDYEVFDQF